jgi:hypothetical protein
MPYHPRSIKAIDDFHADTHDYEVWSVSFDCLDGSKTIGTEPYMLSSPKVSARKFYILSGSTGRFNLDVQRHLVEKQAGKCHALHHARFVLINPRNRKEIAR